MFFMILLLHYLWQSAVNMWVEFQAQSESIQKMASIPLYG